MRKLKLLTVTSVLEEFLRVLGKRTRIVARRNSGLKKITGSRLAPVCLPFLVLILFGRIPKWNLLSF
jgi:hypothetical protein